jgi:hypothetical protein
VWTESRVGPLEVEAADGTVVEARNSSGDLVRMDLAAARRVAVSTGWCTGAGAVRGLVIGLLAGGAGGAVIGYANGDDDPGIVSFSAGEKAIILGVLLGGAGALIGGIAGALSPGEEWQRISLPVDVHVRPDRTGLGLSLSFRSDGSPRIPPPHAGGCVPPHFRRDPPGRPRAGRIPRPAGAPLVRRRSGRDPVAALRQRSMITYVVRQRRRGAGHARASATPGRLTSRAHGTMRSTSPTSSTLPRFAT